MKELMDAWTNFAAKDKEVGATLAGDVRVSGTDKRISWRAKAKDGSTLIIISEPKSSGSASIVVQQMGLQTQALNEKAKATWTAIVGRFIKGLPS